jgi:glycosyltransferase involved in cell wall biosynthesis
MPKLIAVTLTKNERRHIRECIESVAWADAVLVSDSYSDDGTVEIARELGAAVVQYPFINFAEQRNLALADARNLGADWVFFIDADERATRELADEITRAIQNDGVVGWWVPRYNYIMGHKMRGGGWYPDHQLRLLKVGYAHYDPTREVHEVVVLNGEAGYLNEHFIHYNYDTLAHFRAKQNRYRELEARILHKQGIHPHPWTFLSMPLREFWRRYVTLKGYLDGWIGLLLCGLMGWYTFRTYMRLGQLRRQGMQQA